MKSSKEVCLKCEKQFKNLANHKVCRSRLASLELAMLNNRDGSASSDSKLLVCCTCPRLSSGSSVKSTNLPASLSTNSMGKRSVHDEAADSSICILPADVSARTAHLHQLSCSSDITSEQMSQSAVFEQTSITQDERMFESLDRHYKGFRTVTLNDSVDGDNNCSATMSSTPLPVRRSSRIASNTTTRERDSSVKSAHSKIQDDVSAKLHRS